MLIPILIAVLIAMAATPPDNTQDVPVVRAFAAPAGDQLQACRTMWANIHVQTHAGGNANNRINKIEAYLHDANGTLCNTPPAPPPPPPAPPPPPPPPPPPSACTRTLVPGDNVGAALNGLSPGQTACLSTGSYTGNFSVTAPGVTLTASVGASPVVNGYIEIREAANDVTVSQIKVNGLGTNANLIQVWGDRFRFLNNEVDGGYAGTTQNCIYAGHVTYGLAYDLTIDGNRLHRCGNGTSNGHGLYLDAVRGTSRISNNYIYDNSNFGLQFYKDADGIVFDHNVVDGSVANSGVILAGEAASVCGGVGNCASDNNTVRDNILTFNFDYGLDSYWGGTVGTGNTVQHNCVYGNPVAAFGPPVGWVNLGGNILSDPMYVNRAAKDFRLQPGSPCAGLGPQ